MDSTAQKVKFVTFNCKIIKRSVQHMRELCRHHDIIAVQETWLLPYELDFINEIDEDFCGYAKIVCGHHEGAPRTSSWRSASVVEEI